MRTSFLEELAEDIVRRFGEDASNLTIVFPNRRAGLFFRKYLSNLISKPLWVPEIYSIEDFILKFSDLQVADRVTLTFLLYQTYMKHSPIAEDFDRFYYWGELLLDDFDEIDKYMVNAEALFRDLVYQKELESQYDYLSQEQKEAILAFWASFKSRLSRHQEDFLKTWKVLSAIYAEFRNNLMEKGLAYPGMAYRQIAEGPQKYIVTEGHEKIIFAGLNALNNAEETIVKKILADGRGEIIWDTDSFYMENPLHEAGIFLRRYRNDKIFTRFFPKTSPALIEENAERSICLTGVSSEVGQVKKAAELIRDLTFQAGWDPQKTAVILPDERLLFPVLNSLPETLSHINITMGYPLKDTPIYNFIDSLIELHLHRNLLTDGAVFYYKYLLNVVKHAYFQRFNPEQARTVIGQIEDGNRVYIKAGEIVVVPGYPPLFQPVEDYLSLMGLLADFLSFISSADISDMEKEYVFQIKKHLTRLREVLGNASMELNLKTFLKLYRQSIQRARVPFSGEPLNGLQVMGALETRNLDFENIILLSFNEGAFPRSSQLHSFVPFNLRKGHGLPTFEQQDSIYSYNFFRLLQRARNVYIYYNTSTENGGREMSRFLYQLIYGSKIKLEHSLATTDISIENPSQLRIAKSGIVSQKLGRYLDVSADKALTPSAVNIYLDCQLKFYFRYVVDLYEPNQVKEEVDPMVFGNLLHRTMETVYQDFLDVKMRKEVKPLDISFLKGKVGQAVQDAFNKEYGGGGTYMIAGRNIIIAEIIKKMANQVLEKDSIYAPFNILGLEGGAGGRPFKGFVNIQLPDRSRHKVFIKGIVDRIDRKNDMVRIIDYKTGKDEKKFEDIPSLFNRDHPKRNKAAMQTILYSLIYLQIYGDWDCRITPGIFNIRELFSDDFDHRLQIKSEKGYEHIHDIRPYLPVFEEHLQAVLVEIFDPSGYFEQTKDEAKCKYCAYVGICGR